MGAYDNYNQGKAANLFLDFYANFDSKSEAPEILYTRLEDQEAYDTWHLSWYLKEILEIHELQKSAGTNFEDIPRKEKNILVYLLLEAYQKPASLLEFGCALYELIDAVELVETILSPGKNKQTPILDQTSFFSVELSQVMRSGAERLHPNHALGFYNNVKDLDREFDIIYDRNVSSYAISSVETLAEFMSRANVSFHNLFVARDETFISMRMGKSLTYFHLEELLERLDKPLYHLFGHKSAGTRGAGFEPADGKDVIEGFFLCAEPEYAERWLETALQYPVVAKWFAEKEIGLNPADHLW